MAIMLLLTRRHRLQLHCTALHYTALHYTAPFCSVLHCTALHRAFNGLVSLCRRTGSGPTRQWSSGWLPTAKNVRRACRRRCSARYIPISASQHRLHTWLCLRRLHALLTLLMAGCCGSDWSNFMLHSKAWTQAAKSLTLLWRLLRVALGWVRGTLLPAKHVSPQV